jgi:methylglutaconyl-CoA hydratase
MSEDSVLVEPDAGGVAWLTLNRPAVHNAFDETTIAELTEALERCGDDPTCRAVVIRGAGRSFSAGGDLTWMRRAAGFSHAENVADALRLARLMRTLDRLPKPTLALVNGAAMGGGVGLVAASDIALAATDAIFALPEVKLGLIPAVISPYVIAAIGPRPARRYFLTGERFDATEAHRLGLVHAVVPAADLPSAAAALLEQLAGNGSEAMAAAKRLIRDVAGRPVDDALIGDTALRIAEARATDDARARIAAFLDRGKR